MNILSVNTAFIAQALFGLKIGGIVSENKLWYFRLTMF